MDQFVLVGAVGILSQSIVVGITNSAGRRSNSVLSQSLVVNDAHILRAVVSMVNQARCFLSAHDRLVSACSSKAISSLSYRSRTRLV